MRVLFSAFPGRVFPSAFRLAGFRLALLAIFFCAFLCTGASATDLKIKVVDPQGAAVSGAQVLLLNAGRGTVLATQTTSADGVAAITTGIGPQYRVKILAPGFAEETIDLQLQAEFTVTLRLATASETVVVSATRTPVPEGAAGADVDSLNGEQLTTMQPIAADDAVRFLPGAVVNTAGQRGGLSSLFVRGGESNYNKVIVDGVTVNEPGGTFDFGTLSLAQTDRMEFVRGAQSTLYGSDAITSVVQVWTREGSTHVPELRFGADAGNLGTESGHASLAGARGRFDYNAFGHQINSEGSGVNETYSDSLYGANVGARLNNSISLRARFRHGNSHTGIPGEWSFNGYDPLVPANGPTEPPVPLQPNPTEWSQLNNLLGSVELAVNRPSGWQHRFTGFDYLYRYNELDLNGDPQRTDPFGDPIDFPSHEVDHINRAGFEYQGDYSEAAWAHTTFGYRVENENGFVGDVNFSQTHGQRLNNDVYLQQLVTIGRLTAIAGGRFVHNSAYGNTGVPRIALGWQALRGGAIFSGTRLRFSYATGFKEPRLEETFAGPPYTQPNLGLKPERSRSFEAGVLQAFDRGRFALNATYFNNLFHDQINYVTVNPVTFVGEYVNVNKAFAQGAEITLEAKIRPRLLLNTAYTYTSSQYLDNPAPFDAVYNPGQPLLRRPKHSATLLLSYLGTRWGANLGGSFVGRRADSDFYGFGVDHAAGYVRADVGGWFAMNSRITVYANVVNALDGKYNEVVGYPALPVNFRAGMRFRVGGE
jgi:outer membrane cobalamin receptor